MIGSFILIHKSLHGDGVAWQLNFDEVALCVSYLVPVHERVLQYRSKFEGNLRQYE